jgi:hypothetical protein
MSKTYVIQWKSKLNGRAGRGTKRFSLEEAETLVDELNQEYPNIHHELQDSETPGEEQTEPSVATGREAPATTSEDLSDTTSRETHAFSE